MLRRAPALLLPLCLPLILSGIGQAADPPEEAPDIVVTPVPLPPVDFKRLTARRGETVTLIYAITDAGWSALTARDPRIRLEIGLTGETADGALAQRVTSRALDVQTGVLSVGGFPGTPTSMTLAAFDASEHQMPLSIQGVALSRLEIPILEESKAALPPTQLWSVDDRVLSACDQYFSSIAREMKCRKVVGRTPYDPTPMMRACGEEMDGDPVEMACIELAVSAPVPRVDALRACTEYMGGDDDELDCFRLALEARFAVRSVVRACDEIMTGDPRELKCLTLAVQAPSDPTPTLLDCANRFKLEDERLRCIAEAVGAKPPR